MQMNKKPEEAESQSGPRRVKRERPKTGGRISPGAIAKLVRDAYKNEPERILDVSPELFRLLSESEMARKGLHRQSYFENYITERERSELYSRLLSITKDQPFNKEDSVKILELAVPLGLAREEPYKPIVLKAVENLGIDFSQEKDAVKIIKRGEAANRIEVYRGVMLSYDWGGALLDISVIGKDIAIRNAAQSLIGSLSWSPDPSNAVGEGKWAFDEERCIVIDESALASIMNSQDRNHKRTCPEVMRLIDTRCMILCTIESLISIASKVSLLFEVSKAQEIVNFARRLFRVVSCLRLGKNAVLELALSDACRGLGLSSLHAILLCKMTGAPVFATDPRVTKAVSFVNRDSGRIAPLEDMQGGIMDEVPR